ncbi:hypothetical protein BpHYR1_051585 [Brachionus plicatilis]|uniref:Uncharacterized protein n=1 Tax=Brachionus plicatilis TaxID=10195 RepID=A0A3M7PPP1_BRAPC|nr:hypothetical protein BpHYR1_051585 [Brachionus plicatilis]
MVLAIAVSDICFSIVHDLHLKAVFNYLIEITKFKQRLWQKFNNKMTKLHLLSITRTFKM